VCTLRGCRPQSHGRLPGHAVEPVGDRLPRHVRRLADEDEERGLKRILGVMVVEHAATDAPDHRGVPPNQSGKSTLVPASQEAGQEFPIGHPVPVRPDIGQKVLERDSSLRILYLSCDAFINQFMNAVENGEMNQFRHRHRNADILIIDDIHFLAGRDRTQEEFFHTFNTLYQNHKQIILSADCPPSEIPELEERLVSRFNWGLVARIEKPCYETRVAILQKKARLRGLTIPEDVLCYIAAKVAARFLGSRCGVTMGFGLAGSIRGPKFSE